MTNVGDFLLMCLLADVVYHGWQIVLSHFIKAEVKIIESIRKIGVVLSTIDVSSVIAQPYIVASIYQVKSETVIATVDPCLTAG